MRYNFRSKNKEKRKFLFFGILNVLITNIFLQFLLLILPIIFATLLSQLINLCLGLYLYGKKVFGIKRIESLTIVKYSLLSIILWNINWITIEFLFGILKSKNISALIALPIIGIISYLLQRNFIFIREKK
tara:strand:- start:73 stop:465 length:393 start_codon:yes stop_codon:yes gene_type:complete